MISEKLISHLTTYLCLHFVVFWNGKRKPGAPQASDQALPFGLNLAAIMIQTSVRKSSHSPLWWQRKSDLVMWAGAFGRAECGVDSPMHLPSLKLMWSGLPENPTVKAKSVHWLTGQGMGKPTAALSSPPPSRPWKGLSATTEDNPALPPAEPAGREKGTNSRGVWVRCGDSTVVRSELWSAFASFTLHHRQKSPPTP